MKKLKDLYQKHELLFAIFWIVLYVVGMGNLRKLGDDSLPMMLGLIVISALMVLFVLLTGTTEYYGLAGWAKNNRAMLFFIPLWIIASGNIWGGVAPAYGMPGQIFACVSFAFVGFAEELIFRGFLFKAMLKDGSARTAIIVSSVTFGLGHITNLLNGQALNETLVQIVFAILIGFVFTMAFYKGGSLIPLILAHSIIDVLSVFAAERGAVTTWIYHSVLLVLAVGYCLYLAKRVETPAVNRVEAN